MSDGGLYDNEKQTFEYRIVFAGDPGVGKSSIIYQLVENKFYEELPSTIPDTQSITIEENNTVYVYNLNDTAGQEIYRTITSSYYRACNVVFLVYAQDDEESFNSLDGFIEDINEYTKGSKPIIYLLGNKSDLDQNVTVDKAQKYANGKKIVFKQISAKTGEGIQEAFKEVQEKLKGGKGKKPVKKDPSGKKCILL